MNGPATRASTITTTAAIAHFIQVFIRPVWPPPARSVVADATRHDGVTAAKHRAASMVGVTLDDRRPLAGYTIGITGHRRWEEQAEMLSRRGARVVHGPTMATTLLGDLDATIQATRRVMSAPVDLVVFTTGIGVRSWFAAAESLGLDEELRAALSSVAGRGPGAQGPARRPLGRARRHLDGARRRRTTRSSPASARWASPASGSSSSATAARRCSPRRSRRSGPAEIVDVPIYQWRVPEDPTPALRLFEAAASRQLDAVTFTCSYAVHNAFELCPDPGGVAGRVRRRGDGDGGRAGHGPGPA